MPLCPKPLDILEIFVAEVIGSMFLLFFGCVGLIGKMEGQQLDTMQPAVVWAFTVVSCVLIFGPISGAHMNPAVTLCALIHGRISLVMGFVYLVAECIGSTVGIWLVKVMTPSNVYGDNFCAAIVQAKVSIPSAFFSEFIGTSFLIWAVCCAWDPRTEKFSDSMPLKLGFVVGTIIFGLANYSSAAINPARSLGPALVNGKWENHWLYWVAPLSASALTSSLYKYTFLKKYQNDSKKTPQSTNENLMMS